jgi:CubicO group peptidase (beta-lactamase class C family)
VTRRLTGAPFGQQLQALAAPLGADLWCRLPAAQPRRCADVVLVGSDVPEKVDFSGLSGDRLMTMLGYFNPSGFSSIGVVNSQEWRGAEIPSTNSHGTAAGLARLYAALLNPGELLSSDLLAEATTAQSQGYCPFLDEETTFGLGFKPTAPLRAQPRKLRPLRHRGAVGFADPEAALAFSY